MAEYREEDRSEGASGGGTCWSPSPLHVVGAGRRADGVRSVRLGERKLGRAAMEKGDQLVLWGPF